MFGRLEEMRREGLLNINKFVTYKMAATTGTPTSSINITDVVLVVCMLTVGATIAVLLLAAEICAKEIFSRNKRVKYNDEKPATAAVCPVPASGTAVHGKT
jgi:hypothetical protein